ncbi:MAG: hypothetical protein WD187_02930 [Candidatus Woykebacteria bacterium]
MKRLILGSRKRQTIEVLANSDSVCNVCLSQDVVDNFNQVGRKGFARLALSALEARNQANNNIDKQVTMKKI